MRLIGLILGGVVVLAGKIVLALTRHRDPVADALLAKYQREAALLKECRRVCGVKD